MEYLIILLLLLILGYRYEVKSSAISISRKNKLEYVVVVYLIVLSGFAYNVGSDIPIYMNEYDTYSYYNITKLFASSDFVNRQPGWLLLCYICHSISSDFVVLKLVIAIIVNLSIYFFIKKNTRNVFISLFFFCVFLYLDTNFNSLRQGLSIAFFLLSFESLKRFNYKKYYLLALGAYMFHISAILIFIFPLLGWLKIGKRSLVYVTLFLLLTSILIIRFDIAFQINAFMLAGGFMDNESASLAAERYLSGDLANNLNFFGLTSAFIYLSSIAIIVYLYSKQENEHSRFSFLILFFLFSILNFTLPVVFSRYLMYFLMFFSITLSDVIVRFLHEHRSPVFMFGLILLIYIYKPINTLFLYNQRRDSALIEQYYPYYSVFNKQIDSNRASLYGFHE